MVRGRAARSGKAASRVKLSSRVESQPEHRAASPMLSMEDQKIPFHAATRLAVPRLPW